MRKESKMSDNQVEFEIFYNALSVGWHLRKIKEVNPELLKNEKEWIRFMGWLERHDLKCK